ncbi:uncharacterized protein K441DRAFT_651565 [Cenococcum geophilum 1.58]|uniref:uncharacterized protein n=1 Tax=Cenococcum geophilum 1.58 TaxID=794803 RepID=UPI00358FBAA3|nr:hypothetical protein K441DRAFT_651565 [Cenococcum geophilum 1.58]
MYSNDFSLLALFTAGLAALTSAYHAPVGDPSGNPINKPSLNELVPAGKPYTITWTPTTTGPVTILLLRGPSTNVVPIGAPIASGIDNTGTFEWTPPTTLEADTSHYGIQLIVDATGQFQYSTQFGIENPGYAAVSGASSLIASVTAEAVNSTAPSSTPAASASASANITAVSLTHYSTATSHHVASTGAPGNSSVVLPTKSMSIPSSLLTSATGAVTSASASASAASATSTPTGAASHVRAGLGLVGAVAGLVMAL